MLKWQPWLLRQYNNLDFFNVQVLNLFYNKIYLLGILMFHILKLVSTIVLFFLHFCIVFCHSNFVLNHIHSK